VNAIGGLGFGFGALSFDSANNALWALAPVNNLSSQLFQISSSGIVSAPYFTLGDGFAELAAVPASQGASSPEPVTAAGIAAGLVSFAFRLKRRRA
jgi:hypothetical protein